MENVNWLAIALFIISGILFLYGMFQLGLELGKRKSQERESEPEKSKRRIKSSNKRNARQRKRLRRELKLANIDDAEISAMEEILAAMTEGRTD